MKIETYRNLIVKTGNYLESGKYFWEVWRGETMIANTLQSDDKCWDSHEHAAKCAKNHIDLWIDNGVSGYFNRKYEIT